MNGRLQRWRLVLRFALAAGALCLLPRSENWPLALLVFCLHGLVMLLSFAWLFRVNDVALTALLRAYAREWVLYEWVFGYCQPLAEWRVPNRLPASSPVRGVLLLHGFSCNRGLWNGWMTRFRAQGRACMALSMEPVYGSIDAYADEIEAAVQQLTAATGLAPLILCHSMGGLAARAWWRRHGQAGRVRAIITLGTPHAGTPMARWGRALNVRQMLPGGAWLTELAQHETTHPLPTLLCFASDCDQIVFPTASALLPGALHITLPATGHLGLAFHARVQAEVQALLAG